jgi:hypothetical protein
VAGARWTPEADAELIDAIALVGAYDLMRLADITGRTQNAVQQRISKGPPKLRKAAQLSAEKHRKARIGLTAEPEERIDPTNAEVLRLERLLQESEASKRDSERKVKALQKEAGLFEQVAGVVREVVQPLPTSGAILQDGRAATQAGDRTPCDFVLILADEHADEVVSREATWGIEQYDFNIWRCRLSRLRDLTRDYATIHLPRHAPERLWVFKLGDSVNGDIHGHGPKNHFANTIKSAIAVGDAEAQFVQSLIPYFPLGVHVVGVSGNHGRRSEKKDYEGPLDNYDFLVAVQMAARLKEEIDAGRCSVTTPDAWSAYVQVRSMLWGLSHGDDTTGYTGLPWVGFDRRNNRVQTLLGRVERRADAFCYGHYHTPASFPSAGAVSFHSGCWTAADPYAINRLAAGGEPQQRLLVIGDKERERAILLNISLYTRHEETEAAYRRGEYEPDLGQTTTLDYVIPKSEGGLNVVRKD